MFAPERHAAAGTRGGDEDLAKLEQEATSRSPQGDLFSSNAKQTEAREHPALETLRDIDPDSLSPKEALELVYRLRKLSSDDHRLPGIGR